MSTNFLKIIFYLFFSIILNNCSKTDPITNEKILIETDAKKKAEKAAKEGTGLFGDIGKKSQNTTFDFATSNVLWRATLQSLDFLPLINADYSGGIIIYDWYSEDPNSNSYIKISVRFLNNELRSDSVQIISQKKICDTSEKCHVVKLNDKFSTDIKDKIITTARLLKIEESKKNKD